MNRQHLIRSTGRRLAGAANLTAATCGFYAGAVWLRYGHHDEPSDDERDPLLDVLMQRHHVEIAIQRPPNRRRGLGELPSEFACRSSLAFSIFDLVDDADRDRGSSPSCLCWNFDNVPSGCEPGVHATNARITSTIGPPWRFDSTVRFAVSGSTRASHVMSRSAR